MAVLEYASVFSNVLKELYGQELTCNDLFNSNTDIQIVNGKDIKIPTLSVSGYKDHTRGGGFNSGTYSNGYETKTLDHDRDVEFVIDPMDIDETNLVVSIANIQKRFERTHAIPELDCYTYSKLYSEAKRVGALIKTDELNRANILSDFDDNLELLTDAGVPLDRVVLYATPRYKKMLKNAEGISRSLSVSNGENNIDRRVKSLDDIGKIIEVPSARLKTLFDFTNGCVAASTAKQIDYILVDPEAQVSRTKYSYINVYTPGSDSRTADNYIYQNRRFNGTFGIDQLLKSGIIIHTGA